MSNLANDLKEYRLMLAKSKAIPPYCIFDDKALIDLCEKLPTQKEHLIFVNGFSAVGTTRTESYGEEILNIIQYHLKATKQSSPLPELIDSYYIVILEFIKIYNNKFRAKEIAQFLTDCRYFKIYVDRLDDYHSVIHSDFYGILKSCKEDAIYYLCLKLIEQGKLKQNEEDYLYIE